MIIALLGLATLSHGYNLVDLENGVELSESFQYDKVSDIKPLPGSLAVSLNATSINNIMQTFIPILSYFVLNNQTFDLGIDMKSTLYNFKLNQLHIVTVDGFTTKTFEQIDDDKVHVKIGGINIKLLMDAELDALKFIPFKASAVNITNAGIDLVL